MSKNKSKSVIIGRFQPLHLGHEKLIKKKSAKYEETLLVIGSTNKSRTKKNPLDYRERKIILSEIFPEHKILGVEDKGDPELWVSAVEGEVGDKDFIPVSGNEWTIECFKKQGYDKIDVVNKKNLGTEAISGTKIRKKARTGGEWKDMVSRQVKKNLEKINFVNKLSHE